MSTSRGIRNNNPGNIDHSPRNKWQGLADPPLEKGVANPRFARFIAPEYGIRAIAVLLITYQDKYEADSVRKIIARWAPSGENNTLAYINAVSASIGVLPDDQIDVHEYSIMRTLAEAIIKHENGSQPYPVAKINQALHMAGIAPKGVAAKAKSAVSSKTIQGTSVAGTAGAIAAAEHIANVAKEANYTMTPGSVISILLTILVVAGTAYAVWARLKTKREAGA